MKTLLIALSMVAGFASASFAGELDNEAGVTNKQIQGTMVIRVDNRTKQAAALQTSSVLSNDSQAQTVAVKGQFKTLGNNQVRSELDTTGGASSWYFYTGYNYYNYLNYYGCWYQPYYTYNYGYYNYYYYNNYYSNYWWR